MPIFFPKYNISQYFLLFTFRTALHYAASWGCNTTLQLLLTVLLIDVNVKDEEEKTPLFKVRILTISGNSDLLQKIFSNIFLQITIALALNIFKKVLNTKIKIFTRQGW